MRHFPKHFLIAVVLCSVLACDSTDVGDDPASQPPLITTESLLLNPTGYVPLAAELKLETRVPVQVEIEVAGRTSDSEPLIHRFEEIATSFTLPILGLYPEHTNTLHIRFYDNRNQLMGEESRSIDTQKLLPELPGINVSVNTGRQKPGMNLVSYFGHTNSQLPQIPFIFDEEGYIRWYANMVTHPVLGKLFYDAGVERLRSGNLYFGDGSSGRIVEMDMLGNVINEWPIPGYWFHHNVLELPNGNLLATVSKNDLPTIEDHIIEIHRVSGNIVQVWDLRESLDQRRRILSSNPRDWIHSNGLTYDEATDAIIVSGRVQGTIKLSRNNEVIWILGQHRGWDQSGDGTDLKSKLLQPLDASGTPITDPQVLQGFVDHPEFSWPWYQHAPKLTPQGTLFVFDNGDNRHYQGQPVFSRAVEYRIDDQAMTIQQVWEYGRERGFSTYSGIVSDVDYHDDEQSVVFMPGANFQFGPNGKTVEVDYNTKEVLYEAEVRKEAPASGITFHRIERLPIYPSNNQ